VAILFNADNVRVQIAAASSIDDLVAGGAFTVLNWFQVQVATGSNLHIVTKERAFDVANQFGWGFLVNNALASSFSFRGLARRTTTDADATSATFTDYPGNSLWTFGAMVYDDGATEHITFYAGSLTKIAVQLSNASNVNGAGTPDGDNAAAIWIGNIQRAATNELKGPVAISAVFNRALTLNEVRQWQFDPVSMNDAGCVMLLDLHGTGTQHDRSGNGNQGSVVGASAYKHIPLRPMFGRGGLIVPAPGLALFRQVNETQQLTDSVLPRLGLVRLIGDEVELTDGVKIARFLVRLVGDALEMADGVLTPAVFARLVGDSVELDDGVLRLADLVTIIEESENLEDAVASTLGLVRLISESEELSDGLLSLLAAPQLLSDLPMWPKDLLVQPVAGGKFRVSWSYDALGQGGPPADFAVYAGATATTINYDTPLGTVVYSERRRMGFTTPAFADGIPRAFVVRARSGAGIEEKNTYTSAVLTASATGPADAVVLRAKQL